MIPRLFVSLQFVWFLGHLSGLILGLYYLLYAKNMPWGDRIYFKSYLSIFVTYVIILAKSHGVPQISRAFLVRVMMDENMQYLMLAVIWATSSPLSVSLLPFGTFSLYHSLGFIKSELLPAIFPPSDPKFGFARTLSQWIGKFIQRTQSKALVFVAYSEVWVIMPYTIVAIFLRQTGLFTPLLFAHFLRFRYSFSPLTKQAFNQLRVKLDSLLETDRVPPLLKNAYVKARNAIIGFGTEAPQRTQ